MKTKREIQVKFLIDQQEFDYELGMKINKAKWKTIDNFLNGTSVSKEVASQISKAWDSIQEVTVSEALGIANIESRRICFRYIGIDKIFNDLKPELVDDKTIEKSTRVTPEGTLEKFKDTYRLYKVDGEKVSKGGNFRAASDFFILRCNCTSSDREYLIYIQDMWTRSGRKPCAIQAVAWTITTEVAKEDVDYIIRQGDCILVKTKKDDYTRVPARHLEKDEYLEKVRMES